MEQHGRALKALLIHDTYILQVLTPNFGSTILEADDDEKHGLLTQTMSPLQSQLGAYNKLLPAASCN
jgi:hypothetical protein